MRCVRKHWVKFQNFMPIDTSVKAQITESWNLLSIKGHNCGIIKEIYQNQIQT